VSTLTAKNSVTGDQVTEYVYGATLADSDVASSLLKRKEIYPGSVSGSDVVLFAYNRQGQVTQQDDQGGTVRAFDFDKLGRQTQDRVTALGTGVDGAVRRIATGYEVRGMRSAITSLDNAAVGSGTVVNEATFEYNDFAQLATEYQSHSGSVNTSTTPKVQYGFANGSANTIRPTTLTYPDGRLLTYDYGTAGAMDDALSRVASLVDDDPSATQLVDYSYLGLASFVEADDTEPQIRYTLIGTAGGNDPDTGDIYHGLDRFGRVTDSLWRNDGSSTDADRIQYGYDRNGSRTWRENPVASAAGKHFDELYGHDALQRLQTMDRGDLNGAHTSISNLQFAEQWGLDQTGNWRGFRQDDDGSGTWDLDQRRAANTVNEITDITETAGPSWATPVYNAAGNMTTIPQPADPTASFTATYDAWNRLVKVADGSDTVAEYQYDGAKRRVVVKQYVSGSLDETRHVYFTEPSSWQVIEERIDSSSDAHQQFVWGRRYIDDCVLRDRDTTGNGTLDERLYSLQDANWNVTAIIDAAGAVQERFAYSAYGTPLFLRGCRAWGSGMNELPQPGDRIRLVAMPNMWHGAGCLRPPWVCPGGRNLAMRRWGK
jgi:YD repeat-containing protein